MSSQSNKKQVIVYIDGYNLYYGLKEAFDGKYKWLDLQALAESFLRPDMALVAVKYFTAITKSTTGSEQRQAIYLKALQAQCKKLEIIYGWFLSTTKKCRNCGTKYPAFEEKKTDVNLACAILDDTHRNRYDCCYVVSGDSDLVPPLHIIQQNYPDKRVIVAHPPRRKSVELCQAASGWFAIGKQKFRNNQLPNTLTNAKGALLTKPSIWR